MFIYTNSLGAGKRNLQNKSKKNKSIKADKYCNPFDDISFWFSIATTNFLYGLFENETEKTSLLEKQDKEDDKAKK